MAIFDPLFGRRDPPTAPFDEPSGKKVAYGMPMNLQKQCFDFELICGNRNFPRVWYFIENHSFVITLDMEAM